MVELWRERRAAAKKIINNPKSTVEEVDAAVMKLQKMPRDGSPIRVRNRCSQSGRSRGYLRKFGVSRIALRELALEGPDTGSCEIELVEISEFSIANPMKSGESDSDNSYGVK